MEIKIFDKELKIKIQMSVGENFVETFINLGKAFRAENFKNIYIDEYEKNSEQAAFFSHDFIDRKNANYFTVIVMTTDEKRFYDFLKKFCEEHKISFIDPRTQYQEEVRALYKRIDELNILIEESKSQEKQ
jgi:DNA replication initiation complex subunit (GINS family)